MGLALVLLLQGAYALCRVIKRHEAGLLQGEPAARAKGASNARGQMSKVSSTSSLVSSEQQLSALTTTNSSPPPPPPTLDMSSRGMCAMAAESGSTFQVPIPKPPLVRSKKKKRNHFLKPL